MKTVVSEKGQIVIPKALRDHLGLRAGQVLECHEERGRLVASKVSESSPVAAVYGILATRTSTNALVTRLRGKPDAVDR